MQSLCINTTCRVSTSSALVFTFVANDATAQTLNPSDYVAMSSLWEAAGLELDPESFTLYKNAFTGRCTLLVVCGASPWSGVCACT